MDFDENHKNILSRNEPVGFSSRIYYCRSNEGVPFRWEMQPGIPKDPKKQDLPPLTPPPAILSLNLPRPSISQEFSKPSSNWSRRLRFWKRNPGEARDRSSKKVPEGSQECSRDSVEDVFAGFECFSDHESMAMSNMALPFDSSSSSSSSSRSGTSTRGIYGKPLSCFPMHISKIQVSIARRD